MKILLLGFLLSPLWTGALLAQVTPDPVSLYAPLGVAGLICVVLTWVWLRAENRADAAEERERRLNEKMVERIVPLLTEATRVLSETTHSMSTELTRSRVDPARIEDALAELQSVIGEMRGKR